MPELLELPQLVEQHRVAEMEVGRRRVETRLDPELFAVAEPFDELGFDQDFVGAPADDREGLIDIGGDAAFHGISWRSGKYLLFAGDSTSVKLPADCGC